MYLFLIWILDWSAFKLATYFLARSLRIFSPRTTCILEYDVVALYKLYSLPLLVAHVAFVILESRNGNDPDVVHILHPSG